MEKTRAHDTTHILPRRRLGRTNRTVSVLGLGGGGLFLDANKPEEAVRMINRAIDLGMDYLDTAPGYGASESHFGEVLKSRRDEVFLATKIHPRRRDEARRTIEESLERLQTDHLDLLQIHSITSAQDFDRAQEGSLPEMIQARDEGIVRWIGVTGHTDPESLVYAIQRFDFDTVLMPVNVVDKYYLSFIDMVLPLALERDMGVIAMKVYCAGGVFDELSVSPEEALRYALSVPVSTAIIGMESMDELLRNVDIARRFRPMTDEEQAAVLEKTRPNAAVCNRKFKRGQG